MGKLVGAAELAARARDAIGAADEYRRLVGPGGTLSGLVTPAVRRRILSPKWDGRRFWLDDAQSRRAILTRAALTVGP